MQGWDQELKKILGELSIAVEEFEQAAVNKQDDKKLKKRFKKFSIEKQDNVQSAVEKTKKLLDQIYKNYETTAKQNAKNSSLKTAVTLSRTDRDNCVNQVKMVSTLQKQFKKKYEDILKEAQQIEKQEQNKRKKLIQQLQVRIKTVQDQYQTSGKLKIEKYRENQTLKHQLSKLEPQATTTQSLMDAQLKKKQIQIQIQMTTLKQKIQMMENFKKMGSQTKQKLQTSTTVSEKIQKRLAVLQEKQGENKIVVARAHLILEQYKKAIKKINGLLQKHERDALKAQQALLKKKESMRDIDKNISNLQKQAQTQKNQIQILLSMEENLKKQLAL